MARPNRSQNLCIKMVQRIALLKRLLKLVKKRIQ